MYITHIAAQGHVKMLRGCMMTSSNENIFRVTGPCEGNSPINGEFPSQRPVTRSFDVFFDLRLNKRTWKDCQGMPRVVFNLLIT